MDTTRTLERCERENAALIAREDRLRARYLLALAILHLPALSAAFAGLRDDELRDAGLSDAAIAGARGLLAPLRNFAFLDAPPNLAGCGRPHSLAGVAALARAGIGHLVTLSERPVPPAWLDACGVAATHVPMPDRAAPTPEQTARAIAAIEAHLGARGVAVHCDAGIERTGAILAQFLVHRGASAAAALAAVGASREAPPDGSFLSPAQEAAVHAYAAARGRRMGVHDGG